MPNLEIARIVCHLLVDLLLKDAYILQLGGIVYAKFDVVTFRQALAHLLERYSSDLHVELLLSPLPESSLSKSAVEYGLRYLRDASYGITALIYERINASHSYVESDRDSVEDFARVMRENLHQLGYNTEHLDMQSVIDEVSGVFIESKAFWQLRENFRSLLFPTAWTTFQE